ncbi:MAG: hypothetical protein J2P17_20580, partial [Mycobacterium sp.]|nr:hypothetical protein [Mycobacterium sp.]
MTPDRDRLSRRTLIRLSAGTVAAVGLPAVLSACRGIRLPAVGSLTPPPASGQAQYPTYVPFANAPTPDLAATEVVPPAYYTFPTNLVQAVATPPGKGDDITAFTSTVGPPPQPVEQSAAWQAANKAMNLNLKLIIAGNQADQLARLSTMVAGGDIPDAFSTGPTLTIARFPEFLAAQCADLTPFLAGDAVKVFPNLANIPSFVWKGPGTVYGGKIYGLPLPRSLYTAH